MARGIRNQASGSQPAPSQTQRRRRREQDDDEAEDYTQATQAMDVDGEAGDNNEELQRKVNDLVRLALFSEHRRTPLKRDEINKKVFGSGSRSFNVVLVRAQKILRDTFGMDLVELQRDTEETEPEPTQTTGVKKRAAATGTKSYILRSTLHPTIIDIASQTDEDILEEERKAMPDLDDDEQEGFVRPHGSIIAWSGSDNVGAVGILYAILALILVSGKVLNDADLKTQLRRLNLDSGAAVPIGPQATHRIVTIEAFLTQAQRQGYLEQSRIGSDGVAKKGGAKRGRNANDDDNAQYEWRWGPRAHAEVGEHGIARFMAEFMVEQYELEAGVQEEEDDEGDEVQETGPSGRMSAVTAKKVESAMKGIETAAGATLSDVR